jgi:hypothetical protein
MAWRLGSVVMTAVAATMLLGCSVHLPKTSQVAFDYSDYTYYDRGYAPSPSSAEGGYTVREDAAVDSSVAAGRVDSVAAAMSDDQRVTNR